MLHPNQFTVNEAWIAFQLNDQPIRTEQAAESLGVEPERLGIDVIRIAGAQLLPFIGEAQQGFRARFGSQRAH